MAARQLRQRRPPTEEEIKPTTDKAADVPREPQLSQHLSQLSQHLSQLSHQPPQEKGRGGTSERRGTSSERGREEGGEGPYGAPSEAEKLPFPRWLPFLALLLSRSLSASCNLIHDCDETFNYWEPLHFLIYGSGFQTWEYSAANALRSYLYLLLHASVLWPAAQLLGETRLKFLGFYALRAALGLVSAWTESRLVAAAAASVARGGGWASRGGWHGSEKEGEEGREEEAGEREEAEQQGARLGAYATILLCFCSGPFFASTTLLPSTFSMYALAWATSLLLEGRGPTAVGVAASGVLLGWPFAALAAAPLVLTAFWAAGILPVLVAGVAASLLTFAVSILTDWWFYGRVTCSILNLVLYNVAGGGDSALYGVEGPLFYLRNGALNFNLALPLALGLPLAWGLLRQQGRKAWLPVVVACSAPLLLWLGFMSLQPHKEERFLYVVYPMACVCAAASLTVLPRVFWGSPHTPSLLSKALRALRPFLLALILVLSHWRSTAILTYYSAPMEIYRSIPNAPADNTTEAGPVNVCVGSEWHRFPSSFFLPSSSHRLVFLDDGFRGLLPFPFDPSQGGTASSPPYFNRVNKAAPGQFAEDDSPCDYLVELDDRTSDSDTRALRGDKSHWKALKEVPYLDASRSPAVYRAFLIPGVSRERVVFGKYKLLERVPSVPAEPDIDIELDTLRRYA